MSQTTSFSEEIGFCIGPIQIEYPNFLFLSASQKMGGRWRQSDSADNMVVWERMKDIPRVCIPDLALGITRMSTTGDDVKLTTNAVKSALPVAALAASGESFVHQTAPLCPRNVPIQSPVHSLSIGLPSLQLETSK